MTYLFEDYEVDTANFELRMNGETVQVEPQVFDVLAYLVTHRDKIVSRDDLLDNVWNDRYVSDSALSSRIMSARKAVGDGGKEQRLIKTIHGRGFRFLGEVTMGSAPASLQAPVEVVAQNEPHSRTTLAVGRGKEIGALSRAFTAALAGDRAAIFLTGPPGMGKTTLLRDFLIQAGDKAAIMLGQCVPTGSGGEPYRPLLQALSDFASQHTELPVVNTLLQRAPSWLAQLPWLASEEQVLQARERAIGATRERMLREFIDFLEGIANTTPIVLAVDDLHWSDKQTVETMVMAAKRFNPARILVIGTLRSDEPTEQGKDALRTVQELIVRGDASQIVLKTLDRSAVGDLLVRRLGETEVNEELIGSVHRRTDGHPLFLSTVIEEIERNGPESLQTLPENVRKFVAMHFEELSKEDQDIVATASLIGRDFCAAAIAAMLEIDPDEFEEECIRVAKSGRFFSRGGQETLHSGEKSAAFRFHHDVVFEVVHDLTSPTKKKQWYRRFAFWAEKAFEWELDRRALGLSLHFSIGQEWGKSIEYLARAARVAFSRAAAREAMSHALLGLERLEHVENHEEKERLELNLKAILAPAQIAVEGWSADVEDMYNRALELVDEYGDKHERFGLVHGLASLYEMRGEYKLAEKMLHDLAETEARELLACSNFHQGKFEEALTHAECGLDSASPETHSSLMAYYGENPTVSCEQWASLSLWFLGKPHEAVTRAMKALELAEQPGLNYALANARSQLAFLHQIRRVPEETKQWAEATIEIGNKHGLVYRVNYGRVLLGWAQVMLNEQAEGIRNMEEGFEVVRSLGAAMDEPYLLGILGDGLSVAGQTERAIEYIEEALEQADSKRGFFFEPELLRLRGTMEPDAKKAMKWHKRAIEIAEKQGNVSTLLRSLTSLGELGDEDAYTRLKKMVDNIPPDFECPDVDNANTLIKGFKKATAK